MFHVPSGVAITRRVPKPREHQHRCQPEPNQHGHQPSHIQSDRGTLIAVHDRYDHGDEYDRANSHHHRRVVVQVRRRERDERDDSHDARRREQHQLCRADAARYFLIVNDVDSGNLCARC